MKIRPSKEDIQKYTKPITADGNLFSYRGPDYPPNSSSGNEGRFNVRGTSAFYVASGIDCARAEVPDWQHRDCLAVREGITIMVFDVPAFESAYDVEGTFTISKEHGGWSVCQDIAEHLSETAAVSGILYSSHQLGVNGMTGLNIAIIPPNGGKLPDDFFTAPLTTDDT